jgi:hypothetical protein
MTTLKHLKEVAENMAEFQGKTVWNQLLKSNGMFQDDYMIQCCDPKVVLALVNAVEAFKKISKHLGEFEYEEVEGPLDAVDKAMGGGK